MRGKDQIPDKLLAEVRALFERGDSLLAISRETGVSPHLTKRFAKERGWMRGSRPMKPVPPPSSEKPYQKSEPTKPYAFDRYGILPPIRPEIVARAERLYFWGFPIGTISARVGLKAAVVRQLVEECGWTRGPAGVTRKRRVVAGPPPQPSTADLRLDPVPAFRRNYQPSPAGQSIHLSTAYWSKP